MSPRVASLEIQNKDQAKSLIKKQISMVFQNKSIENPSVEAKYIDYDLSRLLELTEEKETLCQEIIADINNYFSQKKNQPKEKFINNLKESVLGKLFYLSLKKNKFLQIKNFTGEKNREYLLKVMEVIEFSELDAISFLDTLKDSRMKNFFTGMISLIYY